MDKPMTIGEIVDKLLKYPRDCNVTLEKPGYITINYNKSRNSPKGFMRAFVQILVDPGSLPRIYYSKVVGENNER